MHKSQRFFMSSSKSDKSSSLQSRFEAIHHKLATREVFDEDINRVRARSLAITAAVEEAEREKKHGPHNVSVPMNSHASPHPVKSPTKTASERPKSNTSHARSNAPRYPAHLKRRLQQAALAMGEEEDNYTAFKGKMQTPYFKAERRFFDDLSVVVDEGVREASMIHNVSPHQSKQPLQSPMLVSAHSNASNAIKVGPIGRANRENPITEARGSSSPRGGNQQQMNPEDKCGPPSPGVEDGVPYVLANVSAPLVPTGPAPVSGVLQKAMEHIRYPEAETNLRGRLKKQYVNASRSSNVVERYFSTPNINPAAATGLGTLTGATKNFSHNTSSMRSISPDSPSPINIQQRKPGAAPIAEGTAHPRFVTASVDFNAMHEEAFLSKHREQHPESITNPMSELSDGATRKEVEVENQSNTPADALYSRLIPEALIKGAESSHHHRELLRTRTDATLSKAEEQVLTGALRSAHSNRPGARGRHDSQFEDEGEDAIMRHHNASTTHRSRAELKEAIERSNTLRAIFAGESDSDDDRGDDTVRQNEEDLPRTGAMRRASRGVRNVTQQASTSFGENNASSVGQSSSAASSQDIIEDLCDLLECSIICFCEYINRTTVLGGSSGGHGVFGGGEASYEGPPRDISILRSILIHSLSSSLPQLKQALVVLEAVQFGTSGVHAIVLEDPLNISAVAASGGLATSTLTVNGSSGPTRISAALKTILRERQQELRFRLFRSWSKAFEVLLTLDLKHDRSASSVLGSLAARAGGAASGALQNHSVMGNATTVGHPEGFTVHNDVHLRKAAAYYCSLHRSNEQRREFLLATWRENKKKYDSALLQGRPLNPFHQTNKELGTESPKNNTGGKGDKFSTPQTTDICLLEQDTDHAKAGEDSASHQASYRPFPIDFDELNSLSPERLRARQANRAKLDGLIEFFATTKQQLSSEDLAQLDFNSANIIFKQQQLASAFLDKLLPKILGSIEYRSSVGGVSGAMSTASLLSKQHEALRPSDKFKRVLLRYANLAGHGTEKNEDGKEIPIEYIDEHDSTKMDTLQIDTTLGAHGNDLSLTPQATRIVGTNEAQTPTPAHKGAELESHANPVGTAKLMSVFRSSWGRSTLSPEVSEAEAIIRSSVLEDSLLISCMDAYFHLLSEPLKQKFQVFVREEKERSKAVAMAAAGAALASGVPSALSNNSNATKDNADAKEALRYTTRMQLLDKYNAMDAAKAQQFAALAQSRKNAADKLRNRHENSPLLEAPHRDMQPGSNEDKPPSVHPSPQHTSIDPNRLKDLQKLLQSTDAWFGYEKGKQSAHKAMMIGAGFGETLGAGANSFEARKLVAESSASPIVPSPTMNLNSSGVLHRSGSSALRRPSSQQGNVFNTSMDPPPSLPADPTQLAATATINRSRAEVLRLNKLHQIQACWTALSIHYIHKLSLHDKWNSTEKDAKTLDKALGLYKEAAVAVLSREAVLEAIGKNEKKLANLGKKPMGGGAFLNKAFASPKPKQAGDQDRSQDLATKAEGLQNSDAIDKLSQLHSTNANIYGGSMAGSPPSPDRNASSTPPTNPTLEAIKEIAATPTTGNPRRDCELARHRLFSELTTCSQRCDVIARRLLNEAGDELLFKGGPYLLKMKEDYASVRDLIKADAKNKF